MTQAKKVASKKPEPKAAPKATVKDSTEIDDLFLTLSSAKKAKTEPIAAASEDAVTEDKKEKKKNDTEVTLSELEDLEEEDFNCNTNDNDSDAENLIKGTAFDLKKDDIFPVSSGATTSKADSDFFDSRGLKRKTRALTEDGYPIYSPKEMKIGMGGGTDLCPFDCNCCF